MQGIVVQVCVQPGAEVQEGDLLFVLEAMKMEKFITAERSGTVESTQVKDGDSVSAGQLLLSFVE
jgi:oxaloacetate decarboxylase alpha subunit